ncbi:MAG: hypothetical protein M0035_01915 [Actinomycetota bacterium]|nr:hypothetical protein [Actinomycetota bacterium]
MTFPRGYRRRVAAPAAGPPSRRALAMRLGSLGSFGAAAALLLAAGPVSAASSSGPSSGWWNESPLPISASPTTPAGDLQVTYSGTSTLAFAAVRYSVPLTSGGQQIDPSSITAALTLSFPSTGVVGTPAIDACPTTSSWSAGGDQPSSKAPTYSCSNGLASSGVYDSGSSTMVWSLGAAQESASTPGVFSVALVPAPGTTSPFSAEISAPSASDFQVLSESSVSQSGGGGSSGTTSGGTSGTSTNTGTNLGGSGYSGSGSSAGSGSGSGSASYVPAGSSASVFNPPPFTATPAATGSSTPSPVSTSATPASAPSTGSSLGGASRGSTRLALGAPVSRKGTSSSNQRTIGLVMLIALGVALAAGASRQNRAPRLVADLAFLGDRTAHAEPGSVHLAG